MRIVVVGAVLAACGGGEGPAIDAPAGVDTPAAGDAPAAADDAATAADAADPEAIPRFSRASHLDPTALARISRFRSGIGHDFSDSFETCRSMKHYFCPAGCLGGPHDPAWTTLVIRSPADGTIVRLDPEQMYGMQVHVQPAGYPDWDVRVFHVSPAAGIQVGTVVTAGQAIGTHASDSTMSDVAVEQHLPGGFRLVSFFDTMTDEAFAAFVARGVMDRQALAITAAERDGAPLMCNGQQFADQGALPNWGDLQ